MSEPIEYPKALYLGGNAEGALAIAEDAAAETALRADGYAMAGEEAAKPAKKKRGE